MSLAKCERFCSFAVPDLPYGRAMSERATYFRDQAEKCRHHADNIRDAETQEMLRTLAAGYIMRAVAIESEERRYGG